MSFYRSLFLFLICVAKVRLCFKLQRYRTWAKNFGVGDVMDNNGAFANASDQAGSRDFCKWKTCYG